QLDRRDEVRRELERQHLRASRGCSDSGARGGAPELGGEGKRLVHSLALSPASKGLLTCRDEPHSGLHPITKRRGGGLAHLPGQQAHCKVQSKTSRTVAAYHCARPCAVGPRAYVRARARRARPEFREPRTTGPTLDREVEREGGGRPGHALDSHLGL